MALTPESQVASAIDQFGDLDLYTFTLNTLRQVVLTATGTSGSVTPCLDLYTGAPAQPVTGGSTCGAPINLNLQAGTYFVLVSENGNNNIGNYNLLLHLP